MNSEMIRLCRKVQMMDAGMVMFRSKLGFGQAIGQVKAEMREYGKVYTAAELAETAVPESTGDFDLFLVWSVAWRVRYISCRVESAGEGAARDADASGSADTGESVHRYAVTFRDGNRSTPLRGAAMTLCIVILILCIFKTGSIVLTAADIILIGYVCFRWHTPSHRARTVVMDLMARVKAID